MSWKTTVGWLVGIILGLCLVLLPSITVGNDIWKISLFVGLLMYFLIRENREAIPRALKAITFTGIGIALLQFVLFIITLQLSKKMMALVGPTTESGMSGSSMLALFEPITAGALIISAFVFIGVPWLLAWLERLTPIDPTGYKRNPWFTLALNILTFNLYTIYWLWLQKKALAKDNLPTRSLWWLLLPAVGMILVYVDFAHAFEQKTKKDFWMWFLLLFLVSGIDIPILQHIINKNVDAPVAL